MRTLGTTLTIALLALAACGKKSEDKAGSAKSGEKSGKTDTKTPDDKTKPDTPDTPPAKVDDPVAAAGVEAGGIERDKDEGSAAALTEMDGPVEVRRVGEPEFAAAKANDDLYPGDIVRTGDNGKASITLADETVIQMAEFTTVGIASRDGSADPASGAAVLGGVARFTVSDRAPGEGAFKVYTPTGVVMTKGTTYVVGVAITGEARIGVEEGAVDVIGLSAMDAEPVVVETGHAASWSADGNVGGSVEWTTDDWGTWRDETEAKADMTTVVSAHGAVLADLAAQLNAAYADMESNADAYADFEAQAATSAEANATADYEAIAPEGAATIEASFDLAGAIEALTWSYSGRAELAGEVYARYPDEVKTQWVIVEPHVDAAILWPKRFEVTAAAYLEPLRVQYYVHHPRGRAHAELVGVVVPEFYGNVEIPEPEPARVRARVRTHVWIAPVVHVRATARPVWIAAPRVGWRAKVKVKAAPPRAKVAFYVRPPTLKATWYYTTAIKVKVKPRIVVKERMPRAKLRVHWKAKADIGTRVKVQPPDLDAAAKARVKVKIDGGVIVRDHRTKVDVVVKDHRDDIKGEVKGKVDVGVDVKGKGDVVVKDHRDDVKGKLDVKEKVDVKVKDHRGDAGGEVKGKVDTKVKVKVKAPEPPKVKVKGKVKVKASGGIKIGN